MLICLYLSFLTGEDVCNIPKISVIIPVFNRQELISVCLSSIANQTFKCLEIICVDDGSTDRSLQILKNFAEKDPRIKVFHQSNCGVSCSRNYGLKIASGEYVSFVDSDDWMESDAFEVVYGIAKENLVDVVVFGFKDERSQKYYGPSEEKLLHGVDSARFFLPTTKNGIRCVWNKIYSSLMLRSGNISFEVSVKFGEDLIFGFDIVPIVNSVFFVNKTLYHYCSQNNGLASQRTIKNIRAFSEHILAHLERLKTQSRYKQIFSDEDVKEVNLVATQIVELVTAQQQKKSGKQHQKKKQERK